MHVIPGGLVGDSDHTVVILLTQLHNIQRLAVVEHLNFPV